MTKFINTSTPYLRILLPDGDYAQFQGGKLEIDEDDPGYATVMAEAQSNPSISIMVSATTCEYCGEVFKGRPAKAQLAKHKKDVHFDLWRAEKEIEQATVIDIEVKKRAGFACDVCAPVQTFGSAADLSEHTRLLHTQPPELNDAGEEVGSGSGRRPGEVEPPAAARRK